MTKKFDVLCVINPKSGSGLGAELLKVTNHPHTKIVSLFNIDKDSLKKLVNDSEMVLIGGGDGTISSIASLCSEASIPIGIIPLGTANDLAKELGVFHVLRGKKFAEIIIYYQKLFSQKQTVTLYLWQIAINNISAYFINYASIGFDAAVADRFAKVRTMKAKGGVWINRTRYLNASLREFLQTKKLQIFDEEVDPAISIIFTNIRSYMGLGILFKGQKVATALKLIKVKSPLDYIKMISRIPTNKNISIEDSAFHLKIAHYLQVDGESLGKIEPGELKIKKQTPCFFLSPLSA